MPLPISQPHQVTRRPKVCFVSNAIAHYRERFLDLLKDRLDEEGIDFEVHIGSQYLGHNISGTLPWANLVKLRTFGSLSWLSVHRGTRKADLVIIPQVIKHLWIYPFLVRHTIGSQKVAFWGHGKLYSAAPESRLASGVKRWVSRHCDWWFAYTQRSANVVRDEIGFPAERITVVNNAVDTNALTNALRNITTEQKIALKETLGIQSDHIAIFVGGMYHSEQHTKRLPFLIEACIVVRASIPDFEMIFVGGGPQQYLVEKAAHQYSWIHYVGVKKGMEAVPYWSVAQLCLNPGLVGLSILDSLALGVPMVTSELPYHSPEIEYLIPERNGVIIDDLDQPQIFADAVISLLNDPSKIQSLASEGLKSAALFTNEAMVENFVKGIVQAINFDLP